MRIEFKKNRMTKEQENEIKVITLLSGFAMEILMKERPFEEINYTYSKKIIEALSQHDVVKNEVAVCECSTRYLDHIQICNAPNCC